MEALLLQFDAPECEPCIWHRDGRIAYGLPLSSEMHERIAALLERWEEGADVDHWAQWSDVDAHGRWLVDALALLGDLNRFFFPQGIVILPDYCQFELEDGWLANVAHLSLYEDPAELTVEAAKTAVTEINSLLSAVDLPPIAIDT